MVLKIKLEWDHKTSANTYECMPLTDSGVAEYGTQAFRKGLNEEIAKMHGWRADRVTAFVGCYFDGCFDYDTSRDGRSFDENNDICIPRRDPRGCTKDEGGPKSEYNCPPKYPG